MRSTWSGSSSKRSRPKVDKVAVAATIKGMRVVSIRDAKSRLHKLARIVESGETIVVTRNGRAVLDLVPHKPQGGLRLEALAEFKKRNGIARIVASIPADFDDPLPEEALL
jgi:prevent-host-death family protein